MDVEFVSPHLLSFDGLVDFKDGIVGFHAAAEGITIGCKLVVVFIEQEGDEFKQQHLVGCEAIDHAFLARAHLVDQLLGGDAEAFTCCDFFSQGQIVFPFHEGVGLVELMPVEAAFHQAVGEELFPGFLLR